MFKILKGNHRKRHILYDEIFDVHNLNLINYKDKNSIAYKSHKDEIFVPVNAGDLVIGDSRLMHGSNPNMSDERRTVITLWYHPDFKNFPNCIKAHLINKQSRVFLVPKYVQKLFGELESTYERNVKPLE